MQDKRTREELAAENDRLRRELDDYRAIESDLRQAMASWEEAEKYRSLFENAAEGLFLCAPGGRLLLGNKALAKMFGFTSFASLRESAGELASLLSVEPKILDDLAQSLSARGAVHGMELLAARRDGAPLWISLSVQTAHDIAGHPVLFHGTVADISARKEVESRLLHESYHDSLTGLVNRAMFLKHLDQAIARARRRETFSFALLCVDVDRLRIINESLGARAGDHVLSEISKVLVDALRTEDSCARLAGDEFALLLSDVFNTADALRVVNRINHALEKPMCVEGQDIYVTLSAGIVLMTGREYEHPETMLADADSALHRAKQDPTIRFAVFNEAMQKEAVERLTVETDLRKALEREEFRVFYQPIVRLETGSIAAFEALVRWERPGMGLVPPALFVPLLEETGLILPVGEWVLRQACAATRRWQQRFSRHGDLVASVNVSAKQLARDTLARTVAKTLDDTGLSPRHLKLEITESVVMDQPEQAQAVLGQLKDLGASLSMDDFGTGYSSLAYLHRFPMDVLKIDKSFVSDMHRDRAGANIVQAVLVLAQHMGKEVVAEGVETADQLAELIRQRCTFAQGYYFAKPLPEAEAESLLARGLGG
ncbi:MAG: bifunctional diguanylate cyclase/phosphodiesterase [Thermodesulfobacteriota bacterium]